MKEWLVRHWTVSSEGEVVDSAEYRIGADSITVEDGVLSFHRQIQGQRWMISAAFYEWTNVRLVEKDPDCECKCCETGTPT